MHSRAMLRSRVRADYSVANHGHVHVSCQATFEPLLYYFLRRAQAKTGLPFDVSLPLGFIHSLDPDHL